MVTSQLLSAGRMSLYGYILHHGMEKRIFPERKQESWQELFILNNLTAMK